MKEVHSLLESVLVLLPALSDRDLVRTILCANVILKAREEKRQKICLKCRLMERGEIEGK